MPTIERPRGNKTKVQYDNEYIKNNYDRVNLTLPKGRKEQIKAVADFEGLSVNAWIAELINKELERLGEL